MSQEQATVAEEEYLQIIYWLQEAGLPITGANIARAMQVSAPTVHEMIGRLEADGYVTRDADKSLAFTETGREHAAQIVRRHRLIERFLTDVFDIPWDQVHEEAERLEHWMSPVRRGADAARDRRRQDLPARPPDLRGRARARRAARRRRGGREGHGPALRERGRGPAALPDGLRPAPRARGHARRLGDDEVAIEVDGERTAITRSVAETVSVQADPSPPPRTALPDQLVLGSERYGR